MNADQALDRLNAVVPFKYAGVARSGRGETWILQTMRVEYTLDRISGLQEARALIELFSTSPSLPPPPEYVATDTLTMRLASLYDRWDKATRIREVTYELYFRSP